MQFVARTCCAGVVGKAIEVEVKVGMPVSVLLLLPPLCECFLCGRTAPNMIPSSIPMVTIASRAASSTTFQKLNLPPHPRFDSGGEASQPMKPPLPNFSLL